MYVENWGPQDFCVAMSDDYDRTRRSLLIREPCVDLLHNTYDFRGVERNSLNHRAGAGKKLEQPELGTLEIIIYIPEVLDTFHLKWLDLSPPLGSIQ